MLGGQGVLSMASCSAPSLACSIPRPPNQNHLQICPNVPWGQNHLGEKHCPKPRAPKDSFSGLQTCFTGPFGVFRKSDSLPSTYKSGNSPYECRFSASPEKLDDPAILSLHLEHGGPFGWGLCSPVGCRAQLLPSLSHVTHLAHEGL